MGALSRALSTICLAAAAILLDVFGLVGDCEPGLRGNGGGARSGSELSHLRLMDVSLCIAFIASSKDDCEVICRACMVLTWVHLLFHYQRRNVDAAVCPPDREKLPFLMLPCWVI